MLRHIDDGLSEGVARCPGALMEGELGTAFFLTAVRVLRSGVDLPRSAAVAEVPKPLGLAVF